MNWGEQGYFKVRKGNTCGICDYGIVPYVEFDEAGNVIDGKIIDKNKEKEDD